MMPTTNRNRPILDLKRWEPLTPAPSATAAGSFMCGAADFRQLHLYVNGTGSAFLYSPLHDGWMTLSSPSLATFGAGAASAAVNGSTGSTIAASTLTATAGTTTSITTNQTLATNLKGYQVLFTAGPNAGVVKTILRNDVGTANAVITFDSPEAVAFSSTSQYRLLTPRWFTFGGGTLAAGSFRVYDLATNTWTSLSTTGLPTTFGTDAELLSTPSYISGAFKAFATGTATAGGASTLTNSAKNWTVNQWANSQIRITSGTGAGQIRTVASNTATVITVSAAWTTQPDATSQYSIEGNDDFLYLMGNAAVALYRYSISGNSWSTLSPVAARAAVTAAGLSGQWVNSVGDALWTDENAIQNGRYIFSFRGGAALDRYDIAGNTWAAITYAPNNVSFAAGSKTVYLRDAIWRTLDATGRWFRYDLVNQRMEGATTSRFTPGTAIVGNTAYSVTYRDGATEIDYICNLLNTSAENLRMMVI